MELFTSLLLLTITVLCLIQYLLHYTHNGKLFNKIPGPYKVPIVGNLFSILGDPVQLFNTFTHYANKYENLYGLQVCQYKIVTVYNPEDIRIILSNPNHNTKSIIYDFFHPWLQQGLLTSAGEKWHHRRKILTPAFHFSILKQFCTIFDEQCENLVNDVSFQGSQTIDLSSVITKCTIDIMCETAMGTHVKADENIYNKYKNAVHNISDIIVQRTVKIWLHLEPMFRMSSLYREQQKLLPLLHGFTTSVIRQRRKERESGDGVQIIHKENIEKEDSMRSSKKRLAMLDLLLSAEAEGRIDEAGIREEVDTFMLEGHDTVASALCFCLMILANHKDAQDKIVQELNEIFEDPDRAATMEDLNNMKYLEMCIKESLRLYPSVPFISREFFEDVQLSDYLVPTGTVCFIRIYDLHRDPSIYPSPDDFIPERFTPENCAKRHPFAYIPFSAGPRNCIGQRFAMLEMKSMISTILKTYVLEPVTKPQDIVMRKEIVLRTNEPLYAKFVPRRKQTQNGINNHHEN